jgi:ABC-type sugar transport system ATPase subunit
LSRARVLLQVANVSKAFGATQALRNASFDLRSGEVHVLLGENGSGKSTLVKILAGVHAPGSGSIELAGSPVAPRSPREAQDLGIATVFQEVLVAEARSVLDNVWMGADHLLRAAVPRGEKRDRARECLDGLLGRSLDLDQPVEELSLGERQACSIARALVRRPTVLMLDEATSALDVATRDRLFEIVRRFCEGGGGVVFITHRLDEIAAIGDRVSVLRSGASVATLNSGEWTSPQLVQLMTGADHLTDNARERGDRIAPRDRELLLSVDQLRLKPDRQPIDARIHAGELIGLAGLEGHGQEAFVDALRGADVPRGAVIRHAGDRATTVRSTVQAARLGIAYAPKERRHALFGWMSIAENFGLPTLRRDTVFGWIRASSTRRRLKTYIEQLNIVLGVQTDRITTLSGGNQQKVLIARCLAAEPRVLLLNDPTRGIDVGAKRDLYALLVKLVDEGMAVVMLSTELDEHVELMDRVLVFREHELFRELPRDKLSRSALVAAFFGQPVGASSA